MKRLHFMLSGLAVLLFLCFSLYMQLELPEPTGPYKVGRTSRHWIDKARPEMMTDAAGDRRESVALLWYPAETGTGAKAPYFPNLARLSRELAASGEVHLLEVYGMRYIRSHSLQAAAVAGAQSAYPVIILSPGNGTNVEFYEALAGELASHGYIVVGLNHPYDVAAVSLSDGETARFASRRWPDELEERQAMVQERIAVRVADVRFTLDRLAELNGDSSNPLAGRLDLAHVGILGHSLGGITASQACLQDERLQACLNLDGLQAGGPFAAHVDPALPAQPFMLITKETEFPPPALAQFEALTSAGYLLSISGATHQHFTDGPLLLPSLLPLPGKADRITALTRSYMLAFFDQTIKEKSSPLLGRSAQSSQVILKVFLPGS